MDDQDRFILLASLWVVYTITLLLVIWAVLAGTRALRRTLYTTALHGPEGSSAQVEDITMLAARYGAVFQVPTGLCAKKIVLCDPTAISHFYANAPVIYRAPDLVREATKNLVGCGLTWVDGEQHYGHRQALATLFTEAAVKQNFSPVFIEMVNKVQNMWTHALESRPRGMVIDIQHWMNSVVLDSLGVTGFSHDFESLKGDSCLVTAAFYTLRAPRTGAFSDTLFHLASYAPSLRTIPTAKNRIINDFRTLMSGIAGDVLSRSVLNGAAADTSVLGLLIQSLAENPEGEFRLSHAEVLAQMNTLLFSGFETTAASLSWLLVELAKNPGFQEKLRSELHHVEGLGNYSQISKIPYLHAVIYEALRLHPPMGGSTRVAVSDDVIPLSTPLAARSGETVSSIKVAKGTVVSVPIRYVNTSEALWGTGSLKYDPGRWWQDKSNLDFPGNRHLAFGDGPRTCLGSEFSLALMKVVITVLMSSFSISLPEGPRTVIEPIGERIPMPRMSGQGSELLLVVRRL
ncbi:cytochrome P450 [Mycena galericulata]|nr:cytochrome P450 [Mycena galericulata]